jgi:outer membrane protein assembly factor BamB
MLTQNTPPATAAELPVRRLRGHPLSGCRTSARRAQRRTGLLERDRSAAGGRVSRGGKRAARARAASGLVGAGLAGVLAIGAGLAAEGGVAAAAPAAAAGPAKTAAAISALLRARSAALPASDWPAYLDGPMHASYNASQTVITPANATSLAQQWSFPTGSPYVASPTVTSTAVYIGSADGWFYKLSVHTGQLLSQVYIGAQPALTCSATGVSSTAAVGFDPRDHVPTVYVAGGDGYLYALRASDLSREWRAVVRIPSTTVNDYYDWSSPTIAHGRIYLGISSSCDKPLIRGGVAAYSQASGRRLAEFYTVPAGRKNAGGSVWSSVGIGPDGDVYATTGNARRARPLLQNSDSILKLNPDTLRLLGSYQIPRAQADSDFGASPVFFGPYVGACNKDGYFYVVKRATMKLRWRWSIDSSAGGPTRGECLAAPAYDGRDLYLGGNEATLGGMTYLGSIQERSATTGRLVWQTGLPGGVLGSPAMDGAGLITVGTSSVPSDGIYLINAATGAIVEQLTDGWTFAQSVFADSWIFTANGNGVAAWGLPVSSSS